MSDTQPAKDIILNVFTPRPGQTEWWVGDGNQFPQQQAGNSHPRLITRTGVLSREQCKLLIACFERNQEALAPRIGNAYWDGRFIWQNSLPAHEVDAQRIMQQARMVALTLLMHTYLPREPIYSDTVQIVRWNVSQELTPHADNVEPDGRPNTTPHRSHASIICLNDDYEGGETFFPGLGVRLKPETGALVLFGANSDYVHGVTKVTKGVRYTCAGWFTRQKKMADHDAMTVF
jgi:predicted 2-oxoglutarate/Fe(II)-dependent dioxygenase YbiX